MPKFDVDVRYITSATLTYDVEDAEAAEEAALDDIGSERFVSITYIGEATE